MPSRWEITLPGIEPGELRWEHLHAVVSRWLDADDVEHHGKSKGWSVTPPRVGRGGPFVEVGLVRDDLVPRLLAGAARGVRVRLGRDHVTLPRHPDQVAAVPWGELGRGHRDRAWSLRLATPMTFRRGNRFTPLPAPSPMLGSLRRSWNTWAPPVEALTLDLAHDPAWVTDLDGRNEVVKVNDRTVSGFIGRVRFECDADGDVALAVHRLVQLAPFTGIGAHTTRGFGVVRLDPTWQPRCRP